LQGAGEVVEQTSHRFQVRAVGTVTKRLAAIEQIFFEHPQGAVLLVHLASQVF
jgi:hypothetical protein